MTRNFSNFLDSYMEYASDNFCPDKFHYWTGISIIAGALERKVWIPYSPEWHIYPNLYIFLVSNPGVGKSSAGQKGVTELLRECPDITFIPSQVTEARMIELMQQATKVFEYGDKKLTQSAGYFYASEASNSIKEVHGDIRSCITDWYDCGKIWDKGTVKNQEMKIYNVCFNMLAGCTFDFLGRLIPANEIMGGFASRLLFIIHDEPFVRKTVFQSGSQIDEERKAKLTEDLQVIHSLAGRMKGDADFKAAYEDWFPKHDKALQDLGSEKLQALVARKHVNALKLAMVFSVSESNDLILRQKHWEKALQHIEELESKLPKILNLSVMSNVESQAGLMQTILDVMEKNNGAAEVMEIRKTLLTKGFDPAKIDQTIKSMGESGMLEVGIISGKPCYRIIGSRKDYL